MMFIFDNRMALINRIIPALAIKVSTLKNKATFVLLIKRKYAAQGWWIVMTIIFFSNTDLRHISANGVSIAS